MTKQIVFDIETYSNYFLVMFKEVGTSNFQAFEMYEGHPLDKKNVERIIKKYEMIGFNSAGFDMPLLAYALKGATTQQIKKMADQIITENMKHWQLGLPDIDCNNIDIINVAPGQASLKIYGGRIHCPTMQDLPIDPSALIGPADREQLKRYCANDLDLTERLFKKLTPQIDLRRKMSAEYGIDLRSMGDAQIAKAVIVQGVTLAREGDSVPKRNHVKPGTTFKYQAPEFIAFRTEQMRGVLEFVKSCEFVINDKGSPECEALEDYEVTFGHSTYRMGVGGIHSSEKCVSHKADENTLLIDRDVGSYYPMVVLACGLYPKNMGPAFLKVYREIVGRRLEAKHAGDTVTADSLKIVVNSSFGLFGNRYSPLYEPSLLIQVTLTGQLALLMLIESIERIGIPVISANTDGIVIKCPKDRLLELEATIWQWEFWTGFITEETRYSALYSRDVNSYAAIKAKDGSVKTKGALATTGLQKSPDAEIVTDAVLSYLTKGVPVSETIRGCTDLTKFLTIRKVDGGAVDQNGVYLGKAVRWYSGKGVVDGLRYQRNGNKVGSSEGAVPCMKLPETFPDDLDFDRYINDATDILKSIGA